MKLDLTGRSPLARAHRDELNAIAIETRAAFNDLTRRLSAPHGDDIDWWVTPLAVRNVFSCALFERCCQLLLVVSAVERGEALDEVVVDSPALAAVLRKALPARAGAIRTPRSAGWYRRRLLRGMAYRLGAQLFHALGQIVFSRVVPGRKRIPADGPVLLVDTFVYRDSFKAEYRDRHYPGLLQWVREEDRKRIYFLPSYYKIRNYASLFRSLRRSATHFLIKEDLLRASDYGFALNHPFRMLAFRIGKCEFARMDIAPMVNEALYESFAVSGSFEGLLRYRLAQRIRDAKVPVSGVVDWFENQEIDHGANAGLRRFLPDVPVTGYQGFVASQHYLCMFPTRDEARLALIPQRVAVMGPALVDAAREFCPELEVCIAPAFRFSHLWRDDVVRRDTQAFTILIALPLVGDEGNALLDLITQATGTGRENDWTVRVKRHPAMPARELEIGPGTAGASRIEVVEDDLAQLLASVDVLVSVSSSACVEALAVGVPAIVMGNSAGLTLNPIPDSVDPGLWTLCHSASELNSALHRYARRDASAVARQRELGRQVRDALFAPPSREAVEALLGIRAPVAAPDGAALAQPKPKVLP